MNETTKQHGEKVRERIFQSIITYITEHGYQPTIREIGDMVGINSTSIVHSHIQ